MELINENKQYKIDNENLKNELNELTIKKDKQIDINQIENKISNDYLEKKKSYQININILKKQKKL